MRKSLHQDGDAFGKGLVAHALHEGDGIVTMSPGSERVLRVTFWRPRPPCSSARAASVIRLSPEVTPTRSR
jgi:hypothetical protein